MVGVSTNFIFLNGVFALCYVRLVLRVDWRAGQVRGEGRYRREGFTATAHAPRDVFYSLFIDGIRWTAVRWG